ncbi:MAG: sigma-70 family RNA polymerase sigma factor [Planctomycetota bacterium]|nr:sigma-70 family RNA polymerase sigma factor [Planctomycetota bacterium]
MESLILERIATGDSAAVTACVEQYGDLVWSIARRLSFSNPDAEDATQEIFLEIWKNSGKYNPGLGSEATFISMIARRRLIDRIRKQNRQIQTVPIESSQDRAGQADKDVIEIAEEFSVARKCLDQLRPSEKEVLELSIFHQLSQSKIAEQLKIPLGTVKSHARRGMTRLKEMLSLEANPGNAK